MLKNKNFYIILLFIAVTFSIMAPIVNHQYIPRAEDYAYHLQNILEAKQALLQGSLILRTEPTVFQGMFYPVFQFYAPTIYTLAGIISFISHNPLDPFKYVIGICVVLGAFYSYRLYSFLFRNEIAALLGGVLYLFSPYLLININARGDFTEAATQGLVPVMLYYGFRLFYQTKLDRQTIKLFLIAIFVFYILATSHLITFLFSSLFMFLLFVFLSSKNKQYFSLLGTLLAFGCAMILASWYLIPLVRFEHLLNMGAYSLFSPWDTVYFTQLSTLLSVKSTNLAPWLADFPLYPGIGLPILLALFYWVYKLGYEKGQTVTEACSPDLLKRLLWVFAIVLFIVWSPTDFWKFLPREASVLQFPYRLLTDIMWLGGLMFAACITDVFKNHLDARHLFIGGFLIAVSGALWMNNNYNSPPTPQNPTPQTIASLQDLSTYKNVDYLAAPALNPVLSQYKPAHNPNLLTLKTTQSICKQIHMSSICEFDLPQMQAIQLPILYYPDLLKITVDGQKVPYFASNSSTGMLVAAIDLPTGQHRVESRFTGLEWANILSGTAWVLYILNIIVFYFYTRTRKSS